MKILFITQLLPFPPHTGGKYKTFSVLKLLAQSHQVHLVTFHTRKIEKQQIKKLESLLNIKVKSFFHPQVTAPSKDIKPVALQSLFSKKPFRVFKYFHLPMTQYLQKLSQQMDFDQIHLDHNTSIQYLKFLNYPNSTPIIFHEHNINSQAMLRMAKVPRKNLIMRLFMLYDALKNYLYEKRIVHQVDHLLAISPLDRKTLIKHGASQKTTHFLPTSFKLNSQFKYQASNPTILIVGLMSWSPNQLGTLWFANYVYPLVKKSLPHCQLIIVGPNPNKTIIDLERKDPSITVTGEVSSLNTYYKKASLLAAPISFGSGIRIKILHALAAGLPVVSTPVGAEGIIQKRQNGVLVAPYQAQLFSRAILKVLTSKKLSNKLSRQGQQLIKNRYSNSQALKVLNQI